MEATIETNGQQAKVTLCGQLDTLAADKFEQQVHPLMEGHDLHVVMDCTQLDYISSSGLRIFLALQKSLSASGGTMVLTHMSDDIREIFEITGFLKIFTVE